MLKCICLGGELYVPENRIIALLPGGSGSGERIAAAFRANNKDGTKIYDCSGRRAKSSLVVVDGGSEGTLIVLSPLSVKTVVKKRMEAES